MSIYYYEPLSQTMNAGQVTALIGSVVLEWSEERQNEIGLFPAYFDSGTVYNKYTETITNSQWTKFNTLADLEEANPAAYLRLTEDSEFTSTGPFYLQVWTVTALTGDAAAAGTQQAKLVVGTQAATLLASLSGYAGQNGCPDTITTYFAEILDLANHSDFPYTLAVDADSGTFASWPVYPDVAPALEAIANAPVATTNADVAFNRILSSYSIPGSYPNKTAAITSAVEEYGVNGSVTDLYNFAVATLTA